MEGTSYAADDPICGFAIRYREIHRRFEEYPWDWDLVGLAADETIQVADLESLGAALRPWTADLSIFRHPATDGSPF